MCHLAFLDARSSSFEAAAFGGLLRMRS